VTSVARSLAVSLALSAMLLRAMLPAGWMPDLAGPLGGAFVICTMDGAQHSPPSHDPSKDHDEGSICPFAAAAHLAPPQLPQAVAQSFAVAFLAPHFADEVARLNHHDPGHAPRGPPASV
jgi:hypothetical protein